MAHPTCVDDRRINTPRSAMATKTSTSTVANRGPLRTPVTPIAVASNHSDIVVADEATR